MARNPRSPLERLPVPLEPPRRKKGLHDVYLIILDKDHKQTLITEVATLEEARLLGWHILDLLKKGQIIIQDPLGNEADWLIRREVA